MTKMLSSWKEIAHFFGKGVRTVQRWEKTLDLPIRRPPGAPSNVVLARTSDLEEWMHRSVAVREAVTSQATSTENLHGVVSELEMEILMYGGQQPQLVEATEKSTLSPEERLKALVVTIRNFNRQSEHSSLKRVA